MRKFYNIRRFILLVILVFCSIFAWSIYTAQSPNPVNVKDTTQHLHSTIESTNKLENSYSKKIEQKSAQVESYLIENNNNDNKIKNIECNINGEYMVSCLKLTSSKTTMVYVPFSFIKKYFEINGKIVHSKNEDHFDWNHSYSKIFYPDQPYDPLEKFLWFESYNVEVRERVKCISAIEQVPISTQWYSKGHFYPTQIAQYGLSHFSKNITEKLPKKNSIIKNGILSQEILRSTLNLVSNENNFFHVANSSILYLNSSHLNYPIFKLNLRIFKKSSIYFYVIDSGSQEYCLQYETSDTDFDLNPKTKTIKYGLGNSRINSEWFSITRNLLVDLFKSNLVVNRKPLNYHIDRIVFTGQMDVQKLTLATSAHGQFAIAAGDWLVRHQNSLGGWDIKVKRKLRKISGDTLTLNEGWHSSMAQGQAMSLLTRLYSVTQETKYLIAAKKALEIFEKESIQHGVKAIFLDKYIWFEEYPTVPSIFVLNGFMYSLFGLYDLSKSCSDSSCVRSGQLFEEGIRSLQNMLPMFDSGSGTFYDLRHLSLYCAPNVARWDYHSTHINQLLHLYTITRRDVLKTTAERWIAYMKGHRAPHN